MNQRREAHHTSLDSLSDKLLKYHDQVIARKLRERENEYDTLHERLDNYEAHISDRIHRERLKKRKDEEEARMRREHEFRKRELLEQIDHEEKRRSEVLAENDRLQEAEEMMIKYGTIAARKGKNLIKAAPTSNKGTSNPSDEDQEIVLSRQRGSDPRDGLLSYDFYKYLYRNVKVIRAPSANLGIAGARALSRALSRGVCPELKSLHLPWNAIGDGGLSYLLEAFSLSSLKLHHIDLTGNWITSEGLFGLKVAVANKKAIALVGLKYLSLRRNPIKSTGAKTLAHMLLKGWLWPTLEVLDISSCNIDVAGLNSLRSALSSEALATRLAPKLQMVTARDNCASSEVFWPNVLQV